MLALEHLVIFQDEGGQAHVLIRVPDVHRHRPPVLQPLLHQTPLPHGEVGLRGGAHRHFADHAGVMVEMYAVPYVFGVSQMNWLQLPKRAETTRSSMHWYWCFMVPSDRPPSG